MSKKKLEETTPTIPAADEAVVNLPMERNNVTAPEIETTLELDTEEYKAETEEPVKPEKSRRAKWILLGILAMIVIAAIGAGIGYGSALNMRKQAETEQRQRLAATQFELGLSELAGGNLDSARRRFEYVISIYPEYPGVSEQLKNVMITIAQNQGGSMVSTPQPGTTPLAPVATRDTRSVKLLLEQAEAQLAAQDWQGLYSTVYQIRDIDPAYESVRVDGLYYQALRHFGVIQIQAGNLENGLYDFSLAEELAPIDRDALSYRTWAEYYIQAGSYWGINWPEAVERFKQLFGMVPNLRDATGITVTQRYAGALEGYGDFLQQTYDWCGAVAQYEQSLSIYADPELVARLPEAKKYCENPPATPTPTIDPYGPTPTPTKKPRKN